MSVDSARPRQWRIVPYVGVFFLTLFQLMGTAKGVADTPGRTDIDAFAVGCAVLGPPSLLLLRRFPMHVLGFLTALILAYLLAGYPYGPVFFSFVIAVVVNVVRGHRYAAWIAAGGTYVIFLAAREQFRGDEWSWNVAAGIGAWVLLMLSVGEVIRVRTERAAEARRAREEAERQEANEERLRIARELHDVVAHHMSLINVQAGVALHLMSREPERVTPALEAIKGASKEALGELRSLVRVLREEGERAPREPAVTMRSLDPLIERSGHAGLTVRQETTGTPRPVSAAAEMAAYRIVQEAITNIVRHSEASYADIAIDYGATMLTVRIDDDGRGDPTELPWGNGLRGMRERASALGGTMQALRSPGGGIRIEAEIPMEEPS